MRIHLWLSLAGSAALALFAGGVGSAQAGSFFGPSCYGADYAYQYPNRAHNYFGCGPDSSCQARHPLFKHRWLRKHQNAQAPVAAPNGMQPNMLPVNAMPVEYVQPPIVQAPVMQAPVITAPIHTTSVAPAPVPATPAVQSRIVPVPAPLPSGPVSPEPPVVKQGKPPF